MAATEAQMDTQLQDAARLVHNLWTAQTLPADLDTLLGNLAGDRGSQFLAAARRVLTRVDDAIGLTGGLLEEWARAYMIHVVAKPPGTFEANMQEIRDYWDTNNKTLLSRAITFGAKSGSTTGTGTVTRLTVDRHAEPIESAQASVKTFVCTRDSGIGGASIHEEIFRVTDAPAQPLLNRATGEAREGGAEYRARSSRDSLLRNSGFNEVTGATSFSGSPSMSALTSANTLTGWTFDTGQIGDHDLDRTNVAETPRGTTNPHSFHATAAFKISQKLSVNNISIDKNRPYHLSVWVYPDSSADGNVVLTLGDQTETVAVSTLTDDTWNYVQFTVDSTRWPTVWNQADPAVKLEWTGTAGTAKFDAMVFCPMFRFPTSGTWFHIGAGTTDWAEGDTFTVTDTIASDTVVQFVLALVGEYLSSVANATQVTASGGRTLTFADAGGSDTITASSGSFVSDGYEVGMLVTIAGTSNNNMTTGPIASVAATVLTFGSGTSLTAEGPLSATATLDGTPSVIDPA